MNSTKKIVTGVFCLTTRDNTKIVCPKDCYGVKVNAEGAVLSGFTFETPSSKEVLRLRVSVRHGHSGAVIGR